MVTRDYWKKDIWFPLLPLCILLLVFPIGVAGQNIGAGVAAVLCIVKCYFDRNRFSSVLARLKSFRTSIILSVLFTASILFSTALNSITPPAEPWRYIASHLYWILLPPLVAVLGPISQYQWQALRKVTVLVSCIFGLAAISQHFFPWQVLGSHFVKGTMRARGFYSHPLTFAYAVFLLWPFCIENLLQQHKSLLSWLGFIGIGAALILSESRTILLIAVGILVYNALFRTRGAMRILLVLVVLGSSVFVALTSNPLAEKIQSTYAAEGFDRHTEYRDDRIAFWLAHLKMVEEKPLLGHGIDLDPAYLAPYYSAIGLENFVKKYPAHNMFLQVLVNGGIVGLVFFLVWYVQVAKISWKKRYDGWGYYVFLQTWVGLALVSMTQNTFQDSEVRYGMTLAVAAIWLAVVKDSELKDVSREIAPSV